MAFGTRIRNGLAKLLATDQPQSRHRGNSIDLNMLKSTMNSTMLTEMVPGLSQPVWGPEISTVGAYSREGYTSRTFDTPAVSFRTMAQALQNDEDVQLAINDLSSKVTGGKHYVKGDSESFIEYMEDFTHNMHFDTFDTILVKELLWYGNSVWKPRMGIANVKNFDDLMHIPISSFQRIWWDRQRVPYKLEFRGAEYQGYHNPGEVLHFKWNPVNASVFGTGFGVSATSTREFTMPLSGEDSVNIQLPSMLDRKYATQFTMQMAEQRYISRNVWIADGASADQRAALQANIENIQIGQDVIAGTNVEIKELGSQGRNFNAAQFADITQGPLFKALNDFRGKQAGESTHTFANAERAALLDELGLTSFPISVREQLNEKLFKPWYDANPFYDVNYMGGMIPVPWHKARFDLNFGQVEKKDVAVPDMIKLIELYLQAPVPKDPKQILKLFEQAGLPIDEDYLVTIDNYYNDPHGQMAIGNMGVPENVYAEYDQPSAPLQLPPNSDMGGGEINPQFDNQVMGSPPMDNPIYNSMMRDVRGPPGPTGNPFVASNFRQSNQSQDWNYGRNYE
jgi:hypothetical protein